MLLCAAAAPGPAAPAAPADVWVAVTVEGEAAVWPGDPEGSENSARRAARVRALEAGGGVVLKSHAILRNNPAMIDELITSTKGLITDEQWSAPRAGKTETTLTIELRARVNQSELARAVCRVVKANHDPKVTLVVVEKPAAEAPWSRRGVVQPHLQAAFTEACFVVDDAAELVTEVSADGRLPQATIDRIVAGSNSQYVAFAAAVVPMPHVGPGPSTVLLTVRLVNTATNEIEAVAAGSASLTDTTEGGVSRMIKERIIPGIMDDLLRKTVARWDGGDCPSSPRVELSVRGVSGAKASKRLRRRCRRCCHRRGSPRARPVAICRSTSTWRAALNGWRSASRARRWVRTPSRSSSWCGAR